MCASKAPEAAATAVASGSVDEQLNVIRQLEAEVVLCSLSLFFHAVCCVFCERAEIAIGLRVSGHRRPIEDP